MKSMKFVCMTDDDGGEKTEDSERLLFPFVRIVGQEEMKRALLLNIVDPSIGGVLIRGEKGTAKSTTVRSLVQVMPPVESSRGCRFHCPVDSVRGMCDRCRALAEAGTIESETRRMTVVELPLNATEDRVSGSLDVENVLATGERRFEGGVLADANGNLLYVDEVNLLDDHIVDLLLDSAAMGRNYVEREGLSFSHPSRFVLVGTMNPEEGTLRPQLLDRFGTCVDVVCGGGVDSRVEVIKRRLAFDADPEGYTASCAADTEALRRRIVDARESLADIVIPDAIVRLVATVSIRFGIEGQRADLAMIRSARANAALEGRTEITADDIVAVGGMVLRHRLKSGPFEEVVFRQDELVRCVKGYR